MTATKDIHDSENSKDHRLKEAFGNETPFKVPNGYFEELPSRIMDACNEINNERDPSIFRRPSVWRISAVAAILILAGLLLTMVFTNKQPKPDALAESSFVELYQLSFNNLAELEETYLLSLAGEEAGNEISDLDTQLNDIDNEEIIEYLLAENHVEYLIINEY